MTEDIDPMMVGGEVVMRVEAMEVVVVATEVGDVEEEAAEVVVVVVEADQCHLMVPIQCMWAICPTVWYRETLNSSSKT